VSAERGVLAALALAEAGRALNQSRSPAPERLSLSLSVSLCLSSRRRWRRRGIKARRWRNAVRQMALKQNNTLPGETLCDVVKKRRHLDSPDLEEKELQQQGVCFPIFKIYFFSPLFLRLD